MPRLTSPSGTAGYDRSFWAADALARRDAAPEQRALLERRTADVCIVGGGYTGLWTAVALKRAAPATSVVVLEAGRCGGQASGRNGGMALSWWPKIEALAERVGADEAARLAAASADAIAQLGGLAAESGVEFDFRQGGWLWTATSDAQRRAWAGTIKACARLGAEPFVELDADETRRRTGSPIHRGAAFEASGATVQPALLAESLAALARRLGVEIFEHTRCLSIDQGSGIVRAAGGEVRAEAIVLATNVWASGLPGLRRAVLPLSSDVLATEPIPELLAQHGWSGGESISDSRLMVYYYRTTADGRIVFGRGGGAIAFGPRMGRAFDFDAGRAAELQDALRRLVPFTRDVRVTHSWAGAVDRSTDGLPFFGRLAGKVPAYYGVGLSGNGVAPTQLAGKILASCALRAEDEWSRCGLSSDVPGRFPPEPARKLGGIVVRNAVRRKERAEDRGGTPAAVDRWLTTFAPSGFAKLTPADDR